MLRRSAKETRSISGHWTPDKDARTCFKCYAEFTMIKRRHHCRVRLVLCENVVGPAGLTTGSAQVCGHVFCADCCNQKANLSVITGKASDVKQRVCFTCASELAPSQRATMSRANSATSIGSFFTPASGKYCDLKPQASKICY